MAVDEMDAASERGLTPTGPPWRREIESVRRAEEISQAERGRVGPRPRAEAEVWLIVFAGPTAVAGCDAQKAHEVPCLAAAVEVGKPPHDPRGRPEVGRVSAVRGVTRVGEVPPRVLIVVVRWIIGRVTKVLVRYHVDSTQDHQIVRAIRMPQAVDNTLVTPIVFKLGHRSETMSPHRPRVVEA